MATGSGMAVLSVIDLVLLAGCGFLFAIGGFKWMNLRGY
jgi:hypothetical protein